MIPALQIATKRKPQPMGLSSALGEITEKLIWRSVAKEQYKKTDQYGLLKCELKNRLKFTI